MATEGGESPPVEAPGAPDRPLEPSDAPGPSLTADAFPGDGPVDGPGDGPGDGEADDVVITTVVAYDETRPAASATDDVDGPSAPAGPPDEPLSVWGGSDTGDDGPGPASAIHGRSSPPADGVPPPPAALAERLAALEAVPATVDTLGKAIRHELERCANVLFGHDRALGALAVRLDAAEAAAAGGGDPAVDNLVERARIAEDTVTRVLEHVDRMEQRLLAMETRVQPLEPLPTVVGALRRAVRVSDDLIAGETAAREQALVALAGQQATEAQSRDDALRRLVAQDLDRVSAVSTAQAKGLADVAERLAAVESRLAPLDSVPEDIAALSRILRRELDAIVSDNQARDQMLRRALQNEIDGLSASSEAREQLGQALGARLDVVETRTAEEALATEAAIASAGGRLEALEARVVAVDRISAELDALGGVVRRDLEQLRSGALAHDQVAGELTRRLSALDARLARLDPVPGEVQSLRTAMLQDSERTVTSLRAAEERIGQLAWVPGEFQEARKRIMALTSGVQAGQDRVRQLETALVSLSERLEGLRVRLTTSTPSPG